jgi:hypothetical protein
MRCPRPLTVTSVVAIAAVSLLAAGCGGGSSTTAATPTTRQTGALAFVHCMHSHGVPNFPDPNSSGEIPKEEVAPLAGSPQFQSAQKACQHLQPGGGPVQSAAQRQSHTAALLPFARCLRSHGFPSFPDPTSSGELTREMLAQAGINLHQPAIVQVADACVGVTHGVLTKAAVARFVAGQ